MYAVYSIFAALLIVVATVCGQSAEPLDQGIILFRAGYLEWSAVKMESGLQIMEQAPPDGLSLYWQAVARFQLALCSGESEPSETVHFLEAAVRRDPQDAESAIMLAVLYGRQIAAKPIRAMWLGRKISALRETALSCGTDNPRVQSLAGSCWFLAPKPFGDHQLALEHLKKAAELYEAEQAEVQDFRQPRWGAAECYGMLGDIMVEKDDIAAARRYYQAALRVNPNYRPARQALEEISDGNEK